jgi:hypothetical protein
VNRIRDWVTSWRKRLSKTWESENGKQEEECRGNVQRRPRGGAGSGQELDEERKEGGYMRVFFGFGRALINE